MEVEYGVQLMRAHPAFLEQHYVSNRIQIMYHSEHIDEQTGETKNYYMAL